MPKLLGQPLDPLFDRLLDGHGKGIGRDRRFLREAPDSGVILRDPARFRKRPDQFLREEGITFCRIPEPLGEVVRDLRRSDERLDERPVLGGGERRERQGHEARIVHEGFEHPGQRMPLVGLRLPVTPDDQGRRRS